MLDHAVSDHEVQFAQVLRQRGLGELTRGTVRTLQVNVGKRCNQACHHCHVEAGPKRLEVMPREVAERVVELVRRNPGIETLDLTGGAPELNPHFRWLVESARQAGRHVIDRCNLTVLLEPGHENLAEFLAKHEVHVVASLPCYLRENVEKQRGDGVFEKSIVALQRLNALGFGQPGLPLVLDLVYNPVGDYLPPSQAKLEADYRQRLRDDFGIEFHRLLTITNMPIKRFADFLVRSGRYQSYLSLLVNHFNPNTVGDLMCRHLLSVGWDGRLYDCDFNQMLELGLGAEGDATTSIWDLDDLDVLHRRRIATGQHCFGCTAGFGSSCGGAMVRP